MKAKRGIIFILIISFSLSLCAENTTDQFSVRGFLTTTSTPSETYSQIEINDLENSAVLENNASINLDLNKAVNGYQVFGWKYYGNYTGNVTLKFQFSPLSNGTSNISFTYTMTTEKATYTRMKSGYVLNLPDSSQESLPQGTNTTKTVSNTNTTASFLYTPNSAATNVQWNRTGKCSIKINSSDLEAAAAGDYVSTVTITVTEGGNN